MKIFTASQIKSCDNYTIEKQNISSEDLMERAAVKCFKWITKKFSAKNNFYIFCGMGNNGGDGLAIARFLLEKNYNVKTYVVRTGKSFSIDAEKNLKKLSKVNYVNDLSEIQIPKKKSVIIDAIFGTGLNRNIENFPKEIIDHINKFKAKKISIDIPSGLFADKLPEKKESIFKADYTLSFQFYKRSFLHPEAHIFIGKEKILNIGLSKKFIKNEVSNNFIISKKSIKDRYKIRNPFGNKSTFGKTVLIGGSYGKMGAIVLSTNSALRIGTGLVFTVAPSCGYNILQIKSPEAMFIFGGEKNISNIIIPDDSIVGIGPGLDTNKETKAAFKKLLSEHKTPMVIDADALNIIASNKKLFELIPEKSILTPHPKEFERLFGKTKNSLEQCELARIKATEHKIIIILKGHRTSILLPNGDCWYNVTGNAGMAKGGSGDVLTGLIAGLIAQKYSPEKAAVIGTFIHGKAGDYAAKELSEETMTAQDIISNFNKVFKYITKKK